MLEVKSLEVSYRAIRVLREVSLTVKQGQIVALLGANGAGKTTTLKAITGLVSTISGQIYLEGKDLVGLLPHVITRRGVAICPEGRRLFANLSVNESAVGRLRSGKSQPFQRIKLGFGHIPPFDRTVASEGRHLERGRAADGSLGPGPNEPSPPVALG
jgi:branched-chain amino acid transport system ATP-binding protein